MMPILNQNADGKYVYNSDVNTFADIPPAAITTQELAQYFLTVISLEEGTDIFNRLSDQAVYEFKEAMLQVAADNDHPLSNQDFAGVYDPDDNDDEGEYLLDEDGVDDHQDEDIYDGSEDNE
jgi:hypothetical protein